MCVGKFSDAVYLFKSDRFSLTMCIARNVTMFVQRHTPPASSLFHNTHLQVGSLALSGIQL